MMTVIYIYGVPIANKPDNLLKPLAQLSKCDLNINIKNLKLFIS